MKLLIVRHAIAMDREAYQASPGAGADHLRPLTPEGLRKMRKNARGISRLGPKPAVIVTSPFTRALQTAEILNGAWPALDLLECDALKPTAKPADLVKWLRDHVDDEAECICLVGHEPHLSELIGWFLTGQAHSFVSLKKGGACLINFEVSPSRGSGELIWLATPAVLKSASSK